MAKDESNIAEAIRLFGRALSIFKEVSGLIGFAEALIGLAAGVPSAAIARQLKISPHTVSSHIDNMLIKSNSSTRAALVAIALRSRID
ncbi:MAG: LuxR C-terminal-related transcriptional regulator [Thermomicrobiales bacterium]